MCGDVYIYIKKSNSKINKKQINKGLYKGSSM